jgi:hypothetical protein
MRAPADRLDLRLLDVHPAHEHRVGPQEIVRSRAIEVLVDESDLPARWQSRRDDQQALRRHEGAHAFGQRIGIFEGAERG